MGTHRFEPPPHLHGRSFTSGEAYAAGLTAKHLRHPRFATPFRGVYELVAEGARGGVTAGHEGTTQVRQLALQFLPILRAGEVFSHTTALVLMGCPIRLPSGLSDTSLHLTVASPKRARRALHIVGHVSRNPIVTWTTEHGLRVASPAQALAQAASIVGVRELVVAADHLVVRLSGQGSGEHDSNALAELRARAQARLQTELREQACLVRGEARRRVLELVSNVHQGSESRMESLTALLLEAFGLLDYFRQQVHVYDEAGWIGRFDFVDERHKVIVEYDGEQHRLNRAQYLKDQSRLERARSVGYRVIRLHRADVLELQHATARRIADALGVACGDALARPHLVWG